MTFIAGDSHDSPLVMKMRRPCRLDCFPGCQQTITVEGKEGVLGYVNQKIDFHPPCRACRLFEITNKNKEPVYKIDTPCCLTATCWSKVEFAICDAETNEMVGEITKEYSNVFQETFTDADRFMIRFPEDCDSAMKGVLIGAVILFDYMFYE